MNNPRDDQLQHHAFPPSPYRVIQWKPEEARIIYEKLEKPNWAPWLEANAETLAKRAEVFPEGQLVIKHDTEGPIAYLSLNRINWNGDKDQLPSWDEVAGNTADYSLTYTPEGNTLVMMSMSVDPHWKGKQLPSVLIGYCQRQRKTSGIECLIGSFRPSGFGQAKKLLGHDLDFWEYCQLTKPFYRDLREHGIGEKRVHVPVDPWLRTLWWHGLTLLKVDPQAMRVEITYKEFLKYKETYKRELWENVETDKWECGEVGHWQVGDFYHTAVYVESNVWGSLPLDFLYR